MSDLTELVIELVNSRCQVRKTADECRLEEEQWLLTKGGVTDDKEGGPSEDCRLTEYEAVWEQKQTKRNIHPTTSGALRGVIIHTDAQDC